jgi:hypothetical protein
MNDKFDFEFSDNDQQKITSMAGHYKSDRPNGFLIIIKIQDEPIRRGIIEMMNSYEDAWTKANEFEKRNQVSRYLGQVKRYAKSGEARSASPMGMLVVFNIWFLAKHGHLVSNACNGCVFAYD